MYTITYMTSHFSEAECADSVVCVSVASYRIPIHVGNYIVSYIYVYFSDFHVWCIIAIIISSLHFPVCTYNILTS